VLELARYLDESAWNVAPLPGLGANVIAERIAAAQGVARRRRDEDAERDTAVKVVALAPPCGQDSSLDERLDDFLNQFDRVTDEEKMRPVLLCYWEVAKDAPTLETRILAEIGRGQTGHSFDTIYGEVSEGIECLVLEEAHFYSHWHQLRFQRLVECLQRHGPLARILIRTDAADDDCDARSRAQVAKQLAWQMAQQGIEFEIVACPGLHYRCWHFLLADGTWQISADRGLDLWKRRPGPEETLPCLAASVRAVKLAVRAAEVRVFAPAGDGDGGETVDLAMAKDIMSTVRPKTLLKRVRETWTLIRRARAGHRLQLLQARKVRRTPLLLAALRLQRAATHGGAGIGTTVAGGEDVEGRVQEFEEARLDAGDPEMRALHEALVAVVRAGQRHDHEWHKAWAAAAEVSRCSDPNACTLAHLIRFLEARPKTWARTWLRPWVNCLRRLHLEALLGLPSPDTEDGELRQNPSEPTRLSRNDGVGLQRQLLRAVGKLDRRCAQLEAGFRAEELDVAFQEVFAFGVDAAGSNESAVAGQRGQDPWEGGEDPWTFAARVPVAAVPAATTSTATPVASAATAATMMNVVTTSPCSEQGSYRTADSEGCSPTAAASILEPMHLMKTIFVTVLAKLALKLYQRCTSRNMRFCGASGTSCVVFTRCSIMTLLLRAPAESTSESLLTCRSLI